MSDEGIEQILNGDIDLYEFLEVQPSNSKPEIRRQYRRKALIYHPDKEGGDAHKFDLLLKAYEILVNDELKNQYDQIKAIKKRKQTSREQLLNLTRQFQEELEKAEKLAQDELNFVNRRKRQNDLEKLKEEGLKRRRTLEEKLTAKSTSKTVTRKYTSFEEIPIKRRITFDDPTSNSSTTNQRLKIKWKYKSELKGLITEDVIKQIMEIFGKVSHVQLLKSKDKHPRYSYALITYENSEDSEKALLYNYRESARLWDGTNVRKLASLLRDCVIVDESKEKDDGIIDKIKGNVNLPADFKLLSIHKPKIDSILNNFTLTHLENLQKM